jgi:subtilisin family serine protease
MKLKNNVTLLLSLLLLFSITLPAGVKYGNYDEFNLDRLKRTATENEFIRIIVKLDVPGIEALTAHSAAFATGDAVKAHIQAAIDADSALDEAISMTRDNVLHRLNGMPYRVARTYSTLPYVSLVTTAETLDALNAMPEVLDIVEDKPTPLPEYEEYQVNQSDNGISAPHLGQSTEIAGAPAAWSFGYTGAGWYVAVLDTGIRTTHDMFKGKDIVEQCFALGNNWYDKENGDCPNGKTEMSGPGSSAHYDNRFSHGSHVAGIACGDDRFAHRGMAIGADIISINVFTYFPDEDFVGSWGSDQVKGLEYVYNQRYNYNIAAANMSLGGGRYFDYCDGDIRAAAIANLRAAGIATTISAGNEARCDSVGTPACISTAISVNATDKYDNEYTNGNWHDDMVALMAPGVNIDSAAALTDHSYATSTGTSMAAPHVAGAFAILRQYDQLHNSMSFEDILATLQNTGLMITSGRCPQRQPKTRLNIGEALKSLFIIPPPLYLSAEQKTNQSLLMTEYVNEITWQANPSNSDKHIANYKIYAVQGSQFNFLAQVDANTFNYLHRDNEKEQEVTYAVVAVTAGGQEGSPAYFTLDFIVSE